MRDDDNLPNEFRFPSLKHDGRMYRVYRSGYSYDRSKSRDPIGNWAVAFETYGDGQVQHSNEWVVQRESFDDWCSSLATHLMEHKELIPIIAYHAGSVDSDDAIEFAIKVKYDPEKEYPKLRYCLEERKMSRHEKYRHDRRWEEAHQYIDGTLDGCCRVLNFATCYDLFAHMARWVHLRERYQAITKRDQGADGHAFKDRFKLDGVESWDAFRCLRELIESSAAIHRAECAIRNWKCEKERQERRRQEQAAIETSKAATLAAAEAAVS